VIVETSGVAVAGVGYVIEIEGIAEREAALNEEKVAPPYTKLDPPPPPPPPPSSTGPRPRHAASPPPPPV
jgi:hypothetical protein